MRYALLVPAVLLSVACDEAETTDGSGYVLAEVRDVEGFTGVEVYGINATVSVGGMQQVKVTSDDNILPSVSTEVIDGVLVVQLEDGAYAPTNLAVDVSVPSLDYVGNHEGADLMVEGVSTAVLTVSASGIGHTELEGTVDLLDIDSAGSGTRNAQDLVATDVVVAATGSSTLWLTAVNTITGTLSEQATLNVFGDPTDRDVSSTDTEAVIYY